MAQDLRTISADTLRLEVYKLTIQQIKQLIEQIYELKRSSIGNEIVCDLERKETILKAEFVRRKYFMPKKKPHDNVDFNEWQKKLANKKRLF